jgi:pyruvate,water dikinase
VTVSDPLHSQSGPNTIWTTVNTGENFPGVATPLGWTFWRDAMDLACKAGFHDIGAVPKRDVRISESFDEASFGAVYGRFVANVSWLRNVADMLPGTSGNALEEQMFGVKPGQPDTSSARRYGVVAVKMPAAALRLNRQMRGQLAEQHSWWARVTAPGAISTVDEARALLAEAARRHFLAMRPHTVASMLGTACYEQVTLLCAGAGLPELRGVLVAGGGTEEVDTVHDLWRVSRDELTLEQFLGRHGYHSSTEAEIATVAWREDPAPVLRLVEAYRQRSDDESPMAAARRNAEERADAERRLLAALPAHRRVAAKATLRAARHYIPLREVGKAAFVQAIDGGRCAARLLGRLYTEQGVLDAPDDVYMLTWKELTGTLPDDVPRTVKERRAKFEEYQTFELPERWTGEPEKLPLGSAPVASAGPIEGIGVSPGVVEGLARVVSDPDTLDLEDGEILVCNTTDPSWASLFLIAGGLVIDVGGPMSHGAIVAREMGLPCVINTRTGTKVLKTGDRLRVDGVAGTVEVLTSG